MNKRGLLGFLFAFALIPGRALFLLMMEFLSMGGMWILILGLLIALIRKGTKRAFLILVSYIAIVLALWFSNALYTPYPVKTEYTENELIRLCEELIKKTNVLHTSDFDKEEILLNAPSVMKIKHAKVKYLKDPKIMNQINLSGIFIPFTGEAVINSSDPDFLLAFISAHELSHRSGILSEGQANMHAYVMCRASESPAFQYSASVYALKYAMNEMRIKNEAEYSRLEKSISPCVRNDLCRMSVNSSKSRLFDYSLFIPCLIYDQSITSQGVI